MEFVNLVILGFRPKLFLSPMGEITLSRGFAVSKGELKVITLGSRLKPDSTCRASCRSFGHRIEERFFSFAHLGKELPLIASIDILDFNMPSIFQDLAVQLHKEELEKGEEDIMKLHVPFKNI